MAEASRLRSVGFLDALVAPLDYTGSRIGQFHGTRPCADRGLSDGYFSMALLSPSQAAVSRGTPKSPLKEHRGSILRGRPYIGIRVPCSEAVL